MRVSTVSACLILGSLDAGVLLLLPAEHGRRSATLRLDATIEFGKELLHGRSWLVVFGSRRALTVISDLDQIIGSSSTTCARFGSLVHQSV